MGTVMRDIKLISTTKENKFIENNVRVSSDKN